jgi:hypothetical protein
MMTMGMIIPMTTSIPMATSVPTVMNMITGITIMIKTGIHMTMVKVLHMHMPRV